MTSTAVTQIKERLSILDVVGQYVELTRAGKSYKGKSPFANEKTPSFFVSPDRGMYYCFSTQKGGDMFTFIEEMEGVDFKGALKILAEKAHVELVPEDPEKRDARETQYALIEEATKFFFAAREAHPSVNTYLTDRGVTPTTVHTWRIGYARDEWRSLKAHLTGKGFTEAMMYDAGLLKHADQGKESYDVFRDRVMFPIMDSSGRVVAFSGRTLKQEVGTPKYVNSPETELYKKSDILYGYDKAKQGIRHYDFSLIVEGQFDLVLSHQAGYTNTVAVSGTAFTEQHLNLLLRLSNRVVLALDSDRAGIAAVKRTGSMMLVRGMDVKVARMPFGKDPADVVRQDPLELKHAIGAATHIVEFLLTVLQEEGKDERTYKLRVREEVLPLLVMMQNRMDREHFEGVVANATGTTKDAVHYEVERIIVEGGHPGAPMRIEAVQDTQVKSLGRKEALMRHLYAFTEEGVTEHESIQVQVRTHLEALCTEKEQAEIRATIEREPSGTFIIEQALETTKVKQLCEDLSEQLTALSHHIARERLRKLRDDIHRAESEGDEKRLMEALEETRIAEKLLQTVIAVTP